MTISTNTYNALGQRVRDVTQTNTTDEAYGAGGSLLWRYTGNSSDPNQRAFVPFGAGILAEYYSNGTPGTIFDHPDELGSATTSSDYTGNNFNEKLFYPYGELWTGAAIPSFNMHQMFGKLPDYDAETDQYNTQNRHYSPGGRWLSPDPGGVKVVRLDDPQTWNMYAYARNNPTTLTDPSGLLPVTPNGGSDPTEKVNNGTIDLDCKVPGGQNSPCTGTSNSSPQEAQNQVIANAAVSQVNSTSYEEHSAKGNYKTGANKCNEFVADTVEKYWSTEAKSTEDGHSGLVGLHQRSHRP